MTDAINDALATPANRGLRLLAYRAQNRPITEMAVEWAKTEIYAGAEGPSLAMLAGLWGQLDALEVEELFEKALVEVGRAPPETDYVLDYTRQLCGCIVQDTLEWDPALTELVTLAGPPLWDERLTYWILFSDDVVSVTEYGEPPNFYPNMTKDNIADCLRQEAALFLKTHCPRLGGVAGLGDAKLDRLVQAARRSRTTGSEADGDAASPVSGGLRLRSSRRYGLLAYAGVAASVFLLGWLSWLFIRKLLGLLN